MSEGPPARDRFVNAIRQVRDEMAARQAALAAVRQVDDAMVDRAARALCAADGGTLENCDGRKLHFADARTALHAALNASEPEEEQRAEGEAETGRLGNNAMLCRFPECAYEQEALATDLAALREAAQAVVDRLHEGNVGAGVDAALGERIIALRTALNASEPEDCPGCGAPAGFPPAGPCANHGTEHASAAAEPEKKR